MKRAVVSIAVLAAALAAASVEPARAQVVMTTLRTTAAAQNVSVSGNWSGYAVAAAGTTFTDVKGSWVVPSVTCPNRASSYSSFWLGLGGYAAGAQALEQTGTSSDCQSGRPVYSAWYELIPAPPVTIPLTVAPGDAITAEATATSATTVQLQIQDVTAGTNYSTTQTVTPADFGSAEWIAEAPSQCAGTRSCRTLPLADFGTATFTAASATANGHAGPISDPAWTSQAIALGAPSGSLAASPSDLSPDGSSFSVAWQASGGQPAFRPRPRSRRWWR